LVTFIVAFPFVWFLITSLKQEHEYNIYPIQFFPDDLQWRNYAEVFNPHYRLLKYASHSLYLALVTPTLSMITSSLAGFAFSRFPDVPGRNKLFSIIIAMIIIPGIVTVIPQFVVYARLKLTNTYWPWILGGLTGSAYNIFLFRQFFLSFPKDLEDAAEVDGCNPFRIYWQIILPNAKPALATVFIFGFSGVWGDWYGPKLYLNTDKTTLAVRLSTAFVNPNGNTLVTLTLAACVMYTLPLVVIFFLGQKYILKGVVTSGLKG
jgi:ABC-type glycerol-3-phosphate transport system permease component